MLTTLIVLTLTACAFLVMFGHGKAALWFGAISIAARFGYRYWIGGEELCAVLADAGFCIAVLPIGWWGAEQLCFIADEPRN